MDTQDTNSDTSVDEQADEVNRRLDENDLDYVPSDDSWSSSDGGSSIYNTSDYDEDDQDPPLCLPLHRRKQYAVVVDDTFLLSDQAPGAEALDLAELLPPLFPNPPFKRPNPPPGVTVTNNVPKQIPYEDIQLHIFANEDENCRELFINIYNTMIRVILFATFYNNYGKAPRLPASVKNVLPQGIIQICEIISTLLDDDTAGAQFFEGVPLSEWKAVDLVEYGKNRDKVKPEEFASKVKESLGLYGLGIGATFLDINGTATRRFYAGQSLAKPWYLGKKYRVGVAELLEKDLTQKSDIKTLEKGKKNSNQKKALKKKIRKNIDYILGTAAETAKIFVGIYNRLFTSHLNIDKTKEIQTRFDEATLTLRNQLSEINRLHLLSYPLYL